MKSKERRKTLAETPRLRPGGMGKRERAIGDGGERNGDQGVRMWLDDDGFFGFFVIRALKACRSRELFSSLLISLGVGFPYLAHQH